MSAALLRRAAPQEIRGWLESVPDPEIPVLSVVDLGVVREIAWEGQTCVVTVTPTYSGCPAMQEIEHGIRQALARQGIGEVDVRTRLAPAWTTDWLSPRGREALRRYGIAPPVQQAVDVSGILPRADAPAVPCPQCGALSTRLVSQSGSTACKALYRCLACKEPFDYFKPH
ncbi:1,2-phenylacetyl-CoA epoxidase subunit PaaD [Orrella sp. JC864]|uniref:1,2-phenylacetyl-CoA epoxidase subunit PaaD n=1 Tax=Orrella sp. JC864 TaxID=3120298 RepID=UPI00142C7449